MDKDEHVIEEQLTVHSTDLMEFRQTRDENAFASTRALVWTYKPASAAPDSSEKGGGSRKERLMNFDATSLAVALSADQIKQLSTLWEVWRTVFSSKESPSGVFPHHPVFILFSPVLMDYFKKIMKSLHSFCGLTSKKHAWHCLASKTSLKPQSHAYWMPIF